MREYWRRGVMRYSVMTTTYCVMLLVCSDLRRSRMIFSIQTRRSQLPICYKCSWKMKKWVKLKKGFYEATGWVREYGELSSSCTQFHSRCFDVLWHFCLDLTLILNLVESVAFVSTVFPSSSQPNRIYQGNFSLETLDVFLQRKQIWNLFKLKCYTFSLNSYVFRRF